MYDKNRKFSMYRSSTFCFRESHFQKKSFLQSFQPFMSGLSGFTILWISETVEHPGLFQPQVIFLFTPFGSISDVRCVMKIVVVSNKISSSRFFTFYYQIGTFKITTTFPLYCSKIFNVNLSCSTFLLIKLCNISMRSIFVT